MRRNYFPVKILLDVTSSFSSHLLAKPLVFFKHFNHKHLQISGHSIIFGSWAMNGIGGLIFWAYAIYILSAFGKKFYLIDRRWLPFIMFILFEALWHILFSPFGYTRGFLCVVIAYSAIELTKLNRSVTTKRLNNN